MKVKDLIRKLQKLEPNAQVAIGSTVSCWSTIGCSTYSGVWFPDKDICGRSYGNVYQDISRLDPSYIKEKGTPVVLLLP